MKSVKSVVKEDGLEKSMNIFHQELERFVEDPRVLAVIREFSFPRDKELFEFETRPTVEIIRSQSLIPLRSKKF